MNIDEQVAWLMRGTEYGDESLRQTMETELRERLIEAEKEGRPLRVYCGYDPSSPDLHLGHTLTMRKLRQFQDLGHDVTFLIGTFTGMVGDPSDKESARRQQTLSDALGKATSYAEQAFRVLDRDKTKIRYNHEWLSELSFADVIGLARIDQVKGVPLYVLAARDPLRCQWLNDRMATQLRRAIAITVGNPVLVEIVPPIVAE